MRVKHRSSNGKLKAPARPKRRRQSDGFSSSFTQKTMSNNTLLAQSLAKEKIRNEKMLSMQRDLIASRNEALMRLNEIETSFERMGMVVKKGIKQLQDIATTMGELYHEIQLFRNNPRDSASMRNSWEEKNCMKKAATNIARMQTVKPMVDGHMITTQPRISLPRIDSRQENTATIELSIPRSQLLSTSPSVSAIEEESDISSDGDNDEDEVRNDSLVCRAPRQSSHMETMKEFYDRVYAQDPQEGPSRPTKRGPQRLVRKVPRGMTKLSSRATEVDSSSDENNVNNVTTLCLVDMDETVIDDLPVSVPVTVASAEMKENKPTTRKMIKELEISPDLSYESVFNISRTSNNQTASETKSVVTSRHSTEMLLNSLCSNIDNGSSDTQCQASPDSPDFLGFSVEDVSESFKIETFTKAKSTSCENSFNRKSTTLKSKSASNSISNGMRVSSQAASPSTKLSDVPKVLEVKLHSVTTLESKDTRTSTAAKRRSGNNGTEKPSSSGKESPKPKETKYLLSLTSESTSSVVMKTPTVILSDVNLSKSKSPYVNGSYRSRSEKSFANNISYDTHETSLVVNKSSLTNHNQPFQTNCSAMDLKKPHQEDLELSAIIRHRKNGKQMNCFNTPQSEELPLETKSASECQKVLLIELERLPTTSKSAQLEPVTKKNKVIRRRRNTHIEGNENTNHVQKSSNRGRKRNSPAPPELSATPVRRSKNNSPNAVLLVTTSTNSRDFLEENSEQSGRRALRRIPSMNYKEPHVNVKLRRPY